MKSWRDDLVDSVALLPATSPDTDGSLLEVLNGIMPGNYACTIIEEIVDHIMRALAEPPELALYDAASEIPGALDDEGKRLPVAPEYLSRALWRLTHRAAIMPALNSDCECE